MFRGFRVSESLAYKELYQQQIEAGDRQTCALVYEVYGLTEEEIGVWRGEKINGEETTVNGVKTGYVANVPL